MFQMLIWLIPIKKWLTIACFIKALQELQTDLVCLMFNKFLLSQDFMADNNLLQFILNFSGR
jgi:hypothetical protein